MVTKLLNFVLMQNFHSYFCVILVFHNFIECEKETKGLSTLGTHTRCAISRTCSSVHCCLHSEVLNTNLDAFIDIDACNGKINVGIERYQWSHKLVGYKFGEMKHVSLFGMINMEWVKFQFWISMLGLSLCVFWGIMKNIFKNNVIFYMWKMDDLYAKTY